LTDLGQAQGDVLAVAINVPGAGMALAFERAFAMKTAALERVCCNSLLRGPASLEKACAMRKA
jgi:hypothetical protein